MPSRRIAQFQPPGRAASFVPALRRMLAAAGLAVLLWHGAAAQGIDYRAMEEVFGEPVTGSATGKPQRASDAPVNMEIITQDDIRRSGAVSIPDVLQFVAGVDVRVYGMGGAEVGIRGYNQPNNPRLLVLVNGRQVYADDYGRVSWLTIPVQLDEIRQIEVIKGPNSALYGFNAVSGVINILTYDPLRDSINTATLRGGTQGYLGGSVVATARIPDKAGIRISLGGFRSRDFAPGSLATPDALSRRSPQVGAFSMEGKLRVAPGVEMVLDGTLADDRVAEKLFSGTFGTLSTRSNSLRMGISADTAMGLLSLSAYRNERLLTVNSVALLGLASSVNEAVYVVQASDLVKLGADHTLRLGVEYRNNALASPGFTGGTIGYEVFAANAMWDWRLLPSLSFTNAVRIDRLQLHYAGFPAAGSGLTTGDYNRAGFAVASFNSGLVFQPTEKDTLRLMAARGVQLPSLIDFGLQVPADGTNPVVASGNPRLRPSIVYNVELNYDRALPVLDSTLRAAVFVQRNEDVISQPLAMPPVLGPAGVPLLLAGNVGRSDAMGVELGIRGHSPSGLRWNASYSFVATTDHTIFNAAPTVTNPVDLARSVPRHSVILGVGYKRDRLEMDLLGRWQSSYRDFKSTGVGVFLQPVEVRDYILLNGRIGYQLTDHLMVAATVQQFNTPRLLRTAGPAVERRALVSITTRF